MAPLDEKKTSEVQGSGRTIFHLLKIIVDVIDDELQVSDAHKCAGKKVDMRKRVVRAVANASSRASGVQAKLGSQGDLTTDYELGGIAVGAIGAAAVTATVVAAGIAAAGEAVLPFLPFIAL